MTAPLVPFLGEVSILGGIPPTPAPAPDLGGVVTTYYVRSDGSDSNDGLTPATAFATLSYALDTRLPAQYRNGAFVFDITGLNQSMAGYTWPSPICNNFFGSFPGSLLGFTGPFTVHSDLVVFQALTAAQVLFVAADPFTAQETVTTAPVLVPNSLQGKLLVQGGLVLGVVKSNTINTIETTSNSLSTGAAIDICDPGAILEDVALLNLLAFTIIEGVQFKSPFGSNALYAQGLQADIALFVFACTVGTYNMSVGVGFFTCYIIPAALSNVNLILGRVELVGCAQFLCLDVCFSDSRVGIFGSYFDSNDPLFSGVNELVSLSAYLDQCEIATPNSSAVVMRGEGTLQVNNCQIHGCPSDCIVLEGPLFAVLDNLPVSFGNGGAGLALSEGAHARATLTVNLANTVTVGNAGNFLWVAVTGSVNNRVNDANPFGGDLSTVRRA